MTSSSNGSSGADKTKAIVFVDKDGRIEILDANVLDLVSGGVTNVSHHPDSPPANYCVNIHCKPVLQ